MSSRNLFRLSGTALIIGSLLSALYYILQTFLPADPASGASPLSIISSVLGFLGSLLVLVGLPGMYLRQAERVGILGLLGTLCFAYITLAQGILIPFTTITIVPMLVANPATQSLAMTPPPAFGTFFLVSTVAQILGPCLLGIATLRARVFPRWPAWLLFAALVLGLLNFLPFYPPALESISAIVGAVAITGFGYALLSAQDHDPMPSVTTRAQAEAHA